VIEDWGTGYLDDFLMEENSNRSPPSVPGFDYCYRDD
jgi:hypothetical protein